jgi:hypothetical protein
MCLYERTWLVAEWSQTRNYLFAVAARFMSATETRERVPNEMFFTSVLQKHWSIKMGSLCDGVIYQLCWIQFIYMRQYEVTTSRNKRPSKIWRFPEAFPISSQWERQQNCIIGNVVHKILYSTRLKSALDSLQANKHINFFPTWCWFWFGLWMMLAAWTSHGEIVPSVPWYWTPWPVFIYLRGPQCNFQLKLLVPAHR